MVQIRHRPKVTRFASGTPEVWELLDRLEDDDWDRARGLLLVLEEPRTLGPNLREKLVPFVAGSDPGLRRDGLPQHLDGYIWVGHEVVVPRRVGRGPALGSDDEVVAVFRKIGQRGLTRLTGLCPLRVKDEDVAALERPRGSAATVGAHVRDQCSVEVVPCGAHGVFIPRTTARSFHQAFEQRGQLAWSREEGRVPARHLDRLHTQLLACRPSRVCRWNGAVSATEDVGCRSIRPPAQRCYLLRRAPVLFA